MATHFAAPVEYNAADASTRSGSASAYAGLPVGVEFFTRYQIFQSDFLHANDVPAAIAHPGLGWTPTEVGAGGTVSLVTDAGFSGIAVVTDALDNDANQVQYTAANAAGEMYLPRAGKKIFFEVTCGFADANGDISTITEIEAFVGLAITDTTVIAGATDFVGFSKVDGDLTWRLVSGKNASTSGLLRDQLVSPALYTLALETDSNVAIVGTNPTKFRRLAFMVDNANTLHAWVDGVHKYTGGSTTQVSDDENLCITLAVMNGAAGAKYLYVSKLFVAQEI